jgi:phosphatidate cytidylyltransferase
MGARVVSGIVLGALAIVVIAHGGLLFFFVALIVGVLGMNEFYRLLRAYRPIALAGFVSLVMLCWAAWFRQPAYVFAVIAAALLLTALMGMAGGAKQGASVRVAVTMLGVVYLGLGLSHLLLLRRLPHGNALLLTVVFGTWAGDTMAYFTGRFFGSTPLAPNLSPKKTWEGLAGGSLGTVLLCVIAGAAYVPVLGAGRALVLGLVIALVGPVGDLFESLLKRDVGIKDAGRFMPGHGGVLDRFDALLFAGVAAYYVLTLGFKI